MGKIKLSKKEDSKPLVSIIIIDSRSESHPSWVQTAIQSATGQNMPVEIIVVHNTKRDKTIGQCWNHGVRKATTDYCFFLGDDDYIVFSHCEMLYRWFLSEQIANTRVQNISSYMTAFEDETGKKTALARQNTGMWKRDYLLKYPFNEELTKGIDREYIEEMLKRGDLCTIIEYDFSYFYRKHSSPSCAGDITFIEKPADYYFCTSNRIFLHPITDRFAKAVGRDNIIISPHTSPEMLKNAKVIFVEWANDRALEVQEFDTDAYKILRLHAFEAFHDTAKSLRYDKWDLVILIDNYIKDYLERQYGKIKNAVVIPNGVEIDRFTLDPNKKRNNKIAFAGYLTRKKGIGELILLAESLPEYEFHLAGRYQEDDIADYFNHKKPKNVFVHNWKYDGEMAKFYEDKSFVLNTSLRESQGMTMMEAALMGAKPLVRNWMGSEDVYPEKYIYKNIDELKSMLEGEWNPQEYRDFVIENYSINDIYPKLENILLQNKKVKVA